MEYPVMAVYSQSLAETLGLDVASAQGLAEPLLAAAIEVSEGINGRSRSVLHIWLQSDSDPRLPEAPLLVHPGAVAGQLPYQLLGKPSRTMRQHLGALTRTLSNRGVLRMSNAPLEGETTLSNDEGAAWSNLPLDQYQREFAPGVTYLAMAFNHAGVVSGNYSSFSFHLERAAGSSELIMNNQLNPAEMVNLSIPSDLFESMKSAFESALRQDDLTVPKRAENTIQFLSSQ